MSEVDIPKSLLAKDFLAFDVSAKAFGPYRLGPDSMPQEGVPRGTVTPYRWTSQQVYPGTERDYWLYVP